MESAFVTVTIPNEGKSLDEEKKQLEEFISISPFYRKFKVSRQLAKISNISSLTFNYYCENDNKDTTFRLYLADEAKQSSIKAHAGALPPNDIELINIINFGHKEAYHFTGECSLCKKEKIEFLIQIFSEGDGENRKFYIRKIGQYPPFDTKPDKEIYNFLTKEDKDNYRKALVNLKSGFGIGAYAYFRRIIENETHLMVKSLIDSEVEGFENIKLAYNNYLKNHQMAQLLDEINDYLPKSFFRLGFNPMKTLYDQLSGGIHTFTDEECLEKAEVIDRIIHFVVKKLNEEKNEIKDLRESIKKLNINKL